MRASLKRWKSRAATIMPAGSLRHPAWIVRVSAFSSWAIETDEAVTAYNGEVAAATQALVPPLLELYVQIGRVGRLRPTAVGTDLKEE